MSDQFGQGAQALSDAANMVSTTQDTLNGLNTKLDNEIRGLTMSWQGQGADSFRLLQQKIDEQQRKINRVLGEFASTMIDTEKVNMATDDDASVANRNLISRLEGNPTI